MTKHNQHYSENTGQKAQGLDENQESNPVEITPEMIEAGVEVFIAAVNDIKRYEGFDSGALELEAHSIVSNIIHHSYSLRGPLK